MIREGEMLTFDFGAKVNGYLSDITRTVAFGKISPELRAIYDTVHDAQQMALDYVAVPGTSEHELGIAADINSQDGNTDWNVYAWLKDNAHNYGFILRYPEGKEDITGIDYEPWHYRYVGEEAAREIYERQITLEEYLMQ